jgi:hypothetical protein
MIVEVLKKTPKLVNKKERKRSHGVCFFKQHESDLKKKYESFKEKKLFLNLDRILTCVSLVSLNNKRKISKLNLKKAY